MLTGRPAGGRDEQGRFEIDSVNRRVEDRLKAYAQIRMSFGSRASSDAADPNP
jgi:hypothetical protein